ncbi:MAG: dTDP-4-dehydrorhamnose reductase [Saprospiraceae bacterium]
MLSFIFPGNAVIGRIQKIRYFHSEMEKKDSKYRVLVTGASGQLGKSFQHIQAAYPEFEFLWATSSDLDISKANSVEHYFDQHALYACINCAAYTAVDRAESEPDAARAVNETGVLNLANACSRQGIPLVHFSTDYVYHGNQNIPFKETDPVGPKSVYAQTKLAGENLALANNPTTMIIRTSWVYAPWGHNFVRTMMRLGAEREELSVVYDQVGSPTYAPDLAAAVLDILRQLLAGHVSEGLLRGIWHYSNEGVASWYDFAAAVFELEGLSCNLKPIETHEFPTPAPRPAYSLLNKYKIKTAFHLEIPYWRESLKTCLHAIPQQAPSRTNQPGDSSE